MVCTVGSRRMDRTAETVLVVDDDSDVRSLHRLWLAESYEVRTAADGVGAFERLDEDVDIVLLDREMPRTDGVAVAEELTERDLDPAVVMVSGVEPSVDLLEIPVDDYIQKPTAREELLARLQRAEAITSKPPQCRDLLALETRLAAVEACRPSEELRSHSIYQRAVDRLERERAGIDRARQTLPVSEAQSAAERAPFGNERRRRKTL